MDQYRDLNLINMEIFDRGSFNLFISYPNIENFYHIQVSDLRCQVYHVSPKKTQSIEEYRTDPANARIFAIIIRHRETEMVSGGKKLLKLRFYKK